MRSFIVATLFASALLAVTHDAAATDRDHDGIEDVTQQARDCGSNGELPVCDDVIRALINDDEAAWIAIANIGSTPLTVTSPRRREVYANASDLRRAVRARGGVRRFLDPAGGNGTRLVLDDNCQSCVVSPGSMNRPCVPCRPPHMVFRVTLAATTVRLRFEADALHVFRLVSVDLP